MKENTYNKVDSIQGLIGYTCQEILSIVRSDIQHKLQEADIHDITITNIVIYGSRARGDARPDSDLDIVIEYEGNMTEYDLFNLLNEEPLQIEEVQVDINPITKGKSGTLMQYMKRIQLYDTEVLQKTYHNSENHTTPSI